MLGPSTESSNSSSPVIRIFRLCDIWNEMPEHGDIVDFLEAHDSVESDSLRTRIEKAAKQTPICPQVDPIETASREHPALITVADVPPERLEWLWAERIPRSKLTLLAGDPGLGKSFVTLDIAARVSRGAPFPDGSDPATAGDVIILSAEDDIGDTIRPRLEVTAADLKRVRILQGVKREGQNGFSHFNLSCDLPTLELAIRQSSSPRLIIIDPVSAYLGGSDSHKNADIRGLLAPLAELAFRYKVAIICVTHLNKNAGGRAIYRTMGSIAFIAAARAGWLIVKDIDDPSRRLMLPAKMNLAVEPSGLAYSIKSTEVEGIGPVGQVWWEADPVNMTADEAIAAELANSDQTEERESISDWLREALTGVAILCEEVKKQAAKNSITPARLRKAKEHIGVISHKVGFGANAPWFWILPKNYDG